MEIWTTKANAKVRGVVRMLGLPCVFTVGNIYFLKCAAEFFFRHCEDEIDILFTNVW